MLKPKLVSCASCPARSRDLCSGLSDSQLPAFYAASTQLRLARGHTLFAAEEPARFVFIIVSGTMKLYRMGPSGQRQVIGFLFVGDLFGLAAGENFGVTAEASTETVLCRWDRSRFDDFLVLFPTMDRQYRLISSKVLARSIDLAYSLGQLTAEQRLASFLAYLHERQSPNGARTKAVILSMTRADIGDYLGLKVETVSRALAQLKRKGIIALPSPDRAEILDMSAVKKLAQGA